RVRVSLSNPAYGHVEGLMRGHAPWVLRRTRPIKTPQTDAMKRSSRFSRLMVDLLLYVQCESIAAETGCWLFLGAHHPSASLPPIHYGSPKLREDHMAGANELGNAFLKIAMALRSSRRQEAVNLTQKLSKLEGQHNHILLEKSRTDALLAAYEAKYGLLGDRVTSSGLPAPCA
ncbi:hypothetical protein JB92DRAFT_2705210, partial [Gautieria morchelliformis]